MQSLSLYPIESDEFYDNQIHEKRICHEAERRCGNKNKTHRDGIRAAHSVDGIRVTDITCANRSHAHTHIYTVQIVYITIFLLVCRIDSSSVYRERDVLSIERDIERERDVLSIGIRIGGK